MNRLGVFLILFSLCGILLMGCGESDNQPAVTRPAMTRGENDSCTKEVRSAEDVVREQLAKMGISEGYKEGPGIVVHLASHETEIKDRANCNEAFRQVAYRKALVNAMREVVRTCNNDNIESRDIVNSNGEATGREIKMLGKLPLYGLRVLTCAESYDRNEGVYQVALAVVWSKRLEMTAKSIVAGECVECGQKEGKKSLVEWLDDFAKTCPLGSREFVDNVGDRWLVGAVLVDEAMRRYMGRWFDGDKQVDVEFKLKAYALDGMVKLLSSDVGYYRETRQLLGDDGASIAKCKEDRVDGIKDETGEFQSDGDDAEILYSTLRRGDKYVMTAGFGEGEETLKDECTIVTDFKIDPCNPRLKWIVRKDVDPISKKEIEIWIGAIRCNDISIGERERKLKGVGVRN